MPHPQNGAGGRDSSALEDHLSRRSASPVRIYRMTTMMTIISTRPVPRSVPDPLRLRLGSRLREWRDRAIARRQLRMLLDCDDRILNDIGLSRLDVTAQLARRF